VQARNPRVRIFLAVFLASLAAGLVYIYSRPAVYVSTARLQVEAAAGEEGDKAMLITAQTLVSHAVLEKVAQKAPPASPEALRSMLVATPVPGTNVVELRGEGEERERLPRILDAWLDVWRETQATARDESSQAAVGDARAGLDQLGRDLAAGRKELEEFSRKFDIVSLERDENQVTARLKGLNTALNDARNREVNAEAHLKAVQDQLAAGRPAIGATDRPMIVDLERRASDLREKMKDLEQEYTSQYLALDTKYKAMRSNLTRLEQQIEKEKQASAGQALNAAEEELAGARQAVLKLQQELSARKRDAQDFTARFSEHAGLASRVQDMQAAYDAEKTRLTQLETARKAPPPKVTVMSPPSVPARPDRPDYARDALIAVLGALALGVSGVWFVEFFQRSGAPRPEPAVQQPIIHISYPQPGVAFEAPVAVLGGTAQRLPETITQLPRELSAPEVRALWAAALPDARVVIAALLGGFTLDEVARLRYEHIDGGADSVHVPGVSARALTLRDPLKRLLIERRGAKAGVPLADDRGQPLSAPDLEGLIACAACDAGLANAAEVTTDVLRHTYFAYLIRQGARLADIGEFIGHMPPAAFREYGRLSPPGPGLPIEQIDPVFPALRAPAA
jgi:uncharacterized protein involved in exopolysaccharide biosynthesis